MANESASRGGLQFFTRIFESALPTHKAGLTIDHNEHLGCYSTVEEYDRNECPGINWVSEGERQMAFLENQMWRIQWYPETPVGFHSLCASSLCALLEYTKGCDPHAAPLGSVK